jgi:predicted alpha/beta-fold hydrolase
MFDRHLTAPTFGFRDEEDYYHSASSLPVLSRITIPTHILQSHDDPMLSELCYPEPHSLKSNISCLYTQMGGHVGFVHGSLRAPRFFVEEEAFRFFTAQID